jgi:hypothetical protein
MWPDDCDLRVVYPPGVSEDGTFAAIEASGLISHLADESVWEYESEDAGWLSFLVDHERVLGIDIARLTPGLAASLDRFMRAAGCELRSEVGGTNVLLSASSGDVLFTTLCELGLPTEPIDPRPPRSGIELGALTSVWFWWANNQLDDGVDDPALAQALDDAFYDATGERALVPDPAVGLIAADAWVERFGLFTVLFRGWRDPPPLPDEEDSDGTDVRWARCPEEPSDGGQVWAACRDIGRVRLVWLTDARFTNDRWHELVRIVESAA